MRTIWVQISQTLPIGRRHIDTTFHWSPTYRFLAFFHSLYDNQRLFLLLQHQLLGHRNARTITLTQSYLVLGSHQPSRSSHRNLEVCALAYIQLAASVVSPPAHSLLFLNYNAYHLIQGRTWFVEAFSFFENEYKTWNVELPLKLNSEVDRVQVKVFTWWWFL